MEYFVAFWIVCSVVTYGYSFGYFYGKYSLIAEQEYWNHIRFCAFMSLLGPFAFAGYIAAFGKEGFRYGFKSW